MVILTVTVPPCGHNRNDIPMETVRHSAPPWPRWELHPLMVIYGHSAPSGHSGNYTHNITAPPVATTGMTLLKVTAPPNGQNRNDTPMETMTVTEPPSGHNGNDTP